MFEHFDAAERTLLQVRARQAAAEKQGVDANDRVHTLRCRVATSWYALPLDNLSAIYREAQIVSVPGAPLPFLGITNVRGRILPVLDLGHLLGQMSPEEHGDLVVVEHPAGAVALYIHQVDDVLSYRPNELKPVPADLASKGAVASLADGTLLLNIDVALNDPNLVIDINLT